MHKHTHIRKQNCSKRQKVCVEFACDRAIVRFVSWSGKLFAREKKNATKWAVNRWGRKLAKLPQLQGRVFCVAFHGMQLLETVTFEIKAMAKSLATLGFNCNSPTNWFINFAYYQLIRIYLIFISISWPSNHRIICSFKMNDRKQFDF